MNIISIDTSSKFCSLSIQLSSNIRDSIISNLALSHSSELAVNLKKLINKYQIKISDLDFVLVNVGRGSFTGLRIGVSFAKGLCLSNNIPLIPINSFDMIDSKVDCNEKIFYILRIWDFNLNYCLLCLQLNFEPERKRRKLPN